MRVCFEFSGFLSGLSVTGSWTSIPFWSSGVTTMKMMRRTRHTSTRGVTLMSLWSLSRLLAPPMPMRSSSCGSLRGLGGRAAALDEVVDQLRGAVGHLDLEPLDLVHEDIEEPDGRDRDEQAERGRDERLRDARGDRRDTARTAHRHSPEGVDDADDRSEQPDEGSGRADRGEAGQPLLHVGGGNAVSYTHLRAHETPEH